jgi:uncharacterized membrane protein YgcG
VPRAGAVHVAALLLLFAAPARADERITDYASKVVVAESGTLTVTETIAVTAEGERIRHGIFRDFPTDYTDRAGRRARVGFRVLSVTRDGHAEPYGVESIDDGKRIKIGDAGTVLAEGAHVYVLSYATDRQIGFFSDYDELYWNATGNLWQFPIDHAEATIVLPDGARIGRNSVYTGALGARGHDARARRISDREIVFDTIEPLGAQEGLTVAVAFPKGVVIPPSKDELRARFLADNAASVAAAAGVAALLVYFLVAWWTHGRDPRRGVVIALFAPPLDFSPAAMRYVHRMAYDRKAYAASLVDMAVKGYLTIAEAHGTYTLARTGKAAPLSHGEQKIAGELFASGESIALKQENHAEIAASVSALKSSLKNEYERVYFVTNGTWFAGGLAILALTAVATAVLCENPPPAIFMLVWLSGWTVGTAFLLHRCYDAWLEVFAGPGSRILNVFGAVFTTVFALPFAGGLIFGIVMLGHSIPLDAALALVLGGVTSYLFYHLLKAPTLAGAKVIDQIEGFRMFLDTAEKDRLEALNPPEITPQVFERFLPYAIALDCENQWSRRFEAASAAAGIAAGRGGYVPVWYSGPSFDRLGAAGFSSALGSSMASAAASAATAPGSSSGSGGGGFSGGGGGGGGGGGW